MKKISNTSFIISLIFAFAMLNFSWSEKEAKEEGYFHRSAELPNLYNDWFAGSGTCVQCHGSDPEGIANVDPEGNDVNVVDDWKATLMANSARDPFWKAKVSHEIQSNPSHQEILENKCTQCHAPMGNYNNVLNGINTYSLAELALDSVALDGVSCLACHQQTDEELGQVFSGTLHFDTLFKAYGPYESPLISPMANATGYIPEYSEHISDAGNCAGCHSLVTETVDLDGNLTGDEFFEQATYHEWLNSDYNIGGDLQSTCQDCHMPKIDPPVMIANGYSTPPRSPYSLHELVGANHFMLNIFENNIDTLGLLANAEDFQSVAEKTLEMLQSSLITYVELIDRTADSAHFEFEIENLAGHKFPSGFPSRRAYIEFVVLDDNQDTLFKSGILNENGYLNGYNSSYEPHYDLISSEDEVQVYEMIMADVNDQPTTLLERAKYALKDNRLPPKGFLDSHFAYDTCAVFGEALIDENFNFSSAQGSGIDKVYYSIPTQGYSGELEVFASVKYQSIPRKWLDDMFTFSGPEIELFEYLFEEAEQNPVTVSSEYLLTNVLSLDDLDQIELNVYPTISSDGLIIIENPALVQNLQLEVYSSNARLLDRKKLENKRLVEYQLNAEKGLYLISLITDNFQQTFRVVLIE